MNTIEFSNRVRPNESDLFTHENQIVVKAKEVAEGMAVFHEERILDKKRQKTEGKSETNPVAQPPIQPCPECGSKLLYKDGLRYLDDGSTLQRWLCRKCGYRFSKKKPLQKNLSWQINTASVLVSKRQVCELLTAESKNLTTVTRQEKAQLEGTTHTTADTKGKLIEFAFHMEKKGLAHETIRGNLGALRALLKRNADIFDPESVKTALAREKAWSQNRRRNVINAYTAFLKFNNMTWEKPKCQTTRKFPFIPTEQELNNLIAGCGKKTATFLQLLKETAMRSDEAKRLEWTNIDFEKNLVTLNEPEKGSNPRMWKDSATLTAMLNMLPRESVKIFGDGPINSMKSTFLKARKRLAFKFQNPRILKISFHTFRHWKATMLYHKTKDPYYVKQFLGHRCLSNTEIYINIERTLFEEQNDEFTVKVAEKPDEIKGLLEVGFEYVCQKEGLVYLRKRK